MYFLCTDGSMTDILTAVNYILWLYVQCLTSLRFDAAER